MGAKPQHYQPWRPETEDDQSQPDDERRAAVESLLTPETLLDLLEHYVFYYDDGGTSKIVARYMQYHAVKKILHQIKEGNRGSRLIWHTQGSGKSLTMLFVARNLMDADWFPTPQILILVDADELRGQFDDDLRAVGFSRYAVANTRKDLYDMVGSGTSKVIVSTIQLFQDAEPELQANENTVILTDEAHRFMEKKLGNRLKAALSQQYYFGFTGTPVEEDHRNTFNEFANIEDDGTAEAYLDRYSIKQGIDDGVILPVHFTIRSDLQWDVDFDEMDEEYEEQFGHIPEDERMEAIKEAVSPRELSEIWPRIEAVSEDIAQHFEEFVQPQWKGMVVAPSRKAAARYGTKLTELLGEEAVEVLYTSRKGDSDEIKQFHTEKSERSGIVESFKRDENPKMLVVCNMLLTGFNAPILKTMYLDEPMRGHRLLQAIARVNRPMPGEYKGHGEVVDYQGILSRVEEALEYDDEIIQKYALSEKDELVGDFADLLSETEGMFEEPDADQEPQNAYISQVAKEPQRSEFKRSIRELQNLYETISPHEELVQYEDRYEWLLKIYQGLLSTEGGTGGSDDEMKEKTLELIEERAEVTEIRHNYPQYRLGADALAEIDDVPDEMRVVHKGSGLGDYLGDRQKDNPQYERLSERLKRVLEQWNRGELEASAAYSSLERIEEQAEAVATKADELGLDDAEYAIYLMLVDEYAEYVAGDEEARSLAEAIGASFDEEVDTSYPRWRMSEQARKHIEETVLDTLISEGRMDLYGDEEFIEECVRYLVQNKD